MLTLGLAVNAQTVFSEDFESVTVTNGIGSMPEGWTLYEDNLTNYHSGQTDYSVFGKSWCVYNMSGWGQGAFCMTYTNEASMVDRWMITPMISIPEDGEYSLYFDFLGSAYNEKLSVMLSTTGTAKEDFTVTLGSGVLPEGEGTKLYNLADYAGQNVYIAFRNYTTDGLYTMIDNIAVKVVAPDALAMYGISTGSYAPMGQSFTVEVTAQNQGSANLTSFDINYSINGGEQTTASVTGINVAPYDTYTYPLSLTIGNAGGATISIELSNPNGVDDQDASDNSGSVNVNVYDPSTTVERTTVLEHFTTAQCPNCPSGHQRLEAAIQGREDRVVWIAHHVGYYTDNMTINESNQMLVFFNDGGSTYAPASMLDRSRDNATSEDPGPVFFPDNSVRNVITNALARPAFVSVDLSNLSFDGRVLTVTVSGSFASSVTMDSPRLSVYIMEDGIIGSQSGASSQYEHNHVIRGCISDVWGDADVITSTEAGATFSKTYTYQVPSTMRPEKTWVAAFVNNFASDVNNREIYNGAKTGYLTSNGIDDVVNPAVSVRTYPNPVTEMAFIEAQGTIRGYNVVNTLGQQVISADNVNADVVELNVSNLAAGIYYVTVRTDGGIATERLTVVK